MSTRLISARACDSQNMMVAAEVCEGTRVGDQLEQFLRDERIEYIQLHNARRGCFSCLARRA